MTAQEGSQVLCVVANSGYPADGVFDHAARFAEALRDSQIGAEVLVLDWRQKGWQAAFRELRHTVRESRPRVAVLHYSHLAWSRRGVPLMFVLLVAELRRHMPVVTWIHDPTSPRDGGLRARGRSAVKAIGLWAGAQLSAKSIVSIHPARVCWIRSAKLSKKVVFCASPSNVGATAWCPPSDLFTVTCFGIAIASEPVEVEPLRAISTLLLANVGQFRLRLLGAHGKSGVPPLVAELVEKGIVCEAPGMLPERDLARLLAGSHVFLSVRTPLSTRSGTLGAALAAGVPVVGFSGDDTADEIVRAARTRPVLDWSGIAEDLTRLARDPEALRNLSDASKALAQSLYTWRPAITSVREVADWEQLR